MLFAQFAEPRGNKIEQHPGSVSAPRILNRERRYPFPCGQIQGSIGRCFNRTASMKTLLAFVASLFACQAFSLAAESPEYLQSFDPLKGFRPAQDNLTQVFLQIAGSLESYGSPEPYLRHMAKEHDRIEGLYLRKNGKASQSYRPAYMTDEYLNRLAANWNLLSPKLGLEPYAKDVGHMMRNAIKGTSGTGTIAIDIFNQHQSHVFDCMAGKSTKAADFETLKAQLIARLELSNTGAHPEPARSDAVTFALGIHGVTMKLFKRLDDGLKPADAEKVKTALTSIFMDVGQMAQSELEAGIAEWALKLQTKPRGQDEVAGPIYSPDTEKALTPDERKVFAAFLRKNRFSRDDFALLDKFYSAAYDKLTDRGKDEMSRRFWAGTRRER